MSQKKTMVMKGDFRIEDVCNGYNAVGNIIPPPKTGVLGGFFSKKVEITPDMVNRVEIEISSVRGEVCSRGQ